MTVRTLSGQVTSKGCSSVQEARMLELNAGFRAECDEQDATNAVDSMIDHVGRLPMNTMFLCEGCRPAMSATQGMFLDM